MISGLKKVIHFEGGTSVLSKILSKLIKWSTEWQEQKEHWNQEPKFHQKKKKLSLHFFKH